MIGFGRIMKAHYGFFSGLYQEVEKEREGGKDRGREREGGAERELRREEDENSFRPCAVASFLSIWWLR